MKTNKELSVDQENELAFLLNGRRTRASGASSHDPGDVITPIEMIEAKVTRGKSISVTKDMWEKIRNEAHTGRKPLIALRWVGENDRPLFDLIVTDVNDYYTDTRSEE